MFGLKKLKSAQRTACGIAAGLLLWVATMGFMLTDPAMESRNPGVFETSPLFVPDIDPETGERVNKPRFLPL
ncbi:hypothetical protein [Aestuariispira insulae]|uniref:Uncharacterized protein n=1 Tax=Aestuariispira insulae TaxID=1461337 RepID=A0A3D9HP72_9PROT|nr:hypothetical protein [Aestuariispira insulae]RED51287.1 hypothetical protein DFP90_10387 [Aestuariispira insulae]